MSPYMMGWTVMVCNSMMSPGFWLKSLFHSLPVKGDYKLSKKNEILVDLFLNTLFHAAPPSPLFLFWSFFHPSLLVPFFLLYFYFGPSAYRFSPESRSGQRPPGSTTFQSMSNLETKASAVGDRLLGDKLSPSSPPLVLVSSFSMKRTPAGMLHWGVKRALRLQSLHAVTRRVTLGTHQQEKGRE